jgi:hypothetical protein
MELVLVLAGHQRIVVDCGCAEAVRHCKRNTGRVEWINAAERLHILLQSRALREGVGAASESEESSGTRPCLQETSAIEHRSLLREK